MYDKKHISQG